MVKVTGYLLREAVRRWMQRAEMAKKVFKGSVWCFPGETKDLIKAGNSNFEAGEAVAILQAAQQQYNQLVTLPAGFAVRGKPMSLAVAVKLIGHAGSCEKEWRMVVTDESGRDRHTLRNPERERSKENEYAAKSVTDEVALKEAEKAGNFAASLRAAIAVANNTAVEMELDPQLFAS